MTKYETKLKEFLQENDDDETILTYFTKYEIEINLVENITQFLENIFILKSFDKQHIVNNPLTITLSNQIYNKNWMELTINQISQPPKVDSIHDLYPIEEKQKLLNLFKDVSEHDQLEQMESFAEMKTQFILRKDTSEKKEIEYRIPKLKKSFFCEHSSYSNFFLYI